MAKSFGASKNTLTLLEGAEVTEEQDYSLTGQASFAGDVSLFKTRPQKGDPHPKNSNLTCYSAKTTYQGLKKIRVDAQYNGIDHSPTPYYLEFMGSVGEQAIVTHPNFVSAIGGTPAAPLNNAAFDADGNFLGFPANAPQYLGGVQTYFVPSVVVRMSYWQNDKPNPGPLGVVQDPSTIDGLILPAQCLDLLVISFAYRQLTPKFPPYQVTIEMLASEINGWNLLIYPYA